MQLAAIAENNVLFCQAIFASKGGTILQELGRHLRRECTARESFNISDSEVTCLHAALTPHHFSDQDKSIRARSIMSLIAMVPREMFTVTDSQGRTPLHLALDFESCNLPSQASIVKALLQHGPEALNSWKKLDSDRSVSVYQYHENLRRKAQNRFRNRQRELREQEEKQSEQLIRPPNQQEPRNQERSQVGVPGKEPEMAKAREAGLGSKKTDAMSKGAMEPPHPRFPDLPARTNANVSSRRDSVSRWETSSQTDAPPRPTTVKSASTKRREVEEQEQNDREAVSDEILHHLRLLCLRSQDPDKASQFLRSLEGNEGESTNFERDVLGSIWI